MAVEVLVVRAALAAFGLTEKTEGIEGHDRCKRCSVFAQEIDMKNAEMQCVCCRLLSADLHFLDMGGHLKLVPGLLQV